MSGPTFRRSGMFRLGGVVNQTLDDLGLRQRVLEQQALDKWKEVVGAHNARASSADRVMEGVLFVSCKSSVWANELALMKEQIIKRLNKALGKKVITGIRFSARGFKRAGADAPKEPAVNGSKSLEAIRLADEDIEAARRLASGCPAPELAEKIERAVLTSKRLAELRISEGWKRCPKCSSVHKAKQDVCLRCGASLGGSTDQR